MVRPTESGHLRDFPEYFCRVDTGYGRVPRTELKIKKRNEHPLVFSRRGDVRGPDCQ